MESSSKAIPVLMRKLAKQNIDDELIYKQVISAPDKLRPLRSIDGKKSWKLSAMLEERFTLMGKWDNAWISQTWLGIPQINDVSKNVALQKQLNLRIEDWTDSIVAKSPPLQVSLYGVDVLDFTETYLIWGPNSEPRIAYYPGSEEKIFTNLKEFLIYLTK